MLDVIRSLRAQGLGLENAGCTRNTPSKTMMSVDVRVSSKHTVSLLDADQANDRDGSLDFEVFGWHSQLVAICNASPL